MSFAESRPNIFGVFLEATEGELMETGEMSASHR